MSTPADFAESFSDHGASTFNVSAATVGDANAPPTDDGPRLPAAPDSNRDVFEGYVTILFEKGDSDQVMLGDEWNAVPRMEQTLAEYERSTREREDDYQLDENWYTPSGQRRHNPQVVATVTNEPLNKYRQIKKFSLEEAVAAAEEQIEAWKAQEIRSRNAKGRKVFESIARGAAETLDLATRTQWEAVETILSRALEPTPRLDLESYYDRRVFPEFEFEDAPEEPAYPEKPLRNSVGLLEKIFPPWKRWKQGHYLSLLGDWETTTSRMHELWEIECEQWHALREQAQQTHAREAELFRQQQAAHNRAVAAFESAFESAAPRALTRYIKTSLDRKPFPWVFPVDREVSYESQSKTAVIDVALPPLDKITDVAGYKFIKSRLTAKPVPQKAAERGRLYESAVEQTVLGTLWQTFQSLPADQIAAVVVNGWIVDRDPATGLERTTCVVSVSVDRAQLENMDLACVDTTECIRNLKGLVAAPFADVAPVAPIMHLNREDGRFVESREVLSEINGKTNLAEIGWEDFEHLVRELFSRLFEREGADVRVTQSSGDGGVDAIAFDPDPIRGGKFVIQAKRYTKVVPVSAVRDLFGTMISEGASKGILVTTSHYGSDSRQFVKDKPITLIDGQNLVHLLEEHGYSVRIDVAAARANQKRNPLAR